jgi:hypothetical protein
LGALQLFGCAGPQRASTPVVAKDRAAAELVELFEDTGSAKPEKSSTETEPQFAPFAEELPEAADVSFSPLPTLETKVEVYHWDVITGGAIGNFVTGVVDNRLKRPVAVAVRGAYIYIVDAGLEMVLRYDQATGRLSAVLDLKAAVTGEVADIYVANDLSFYITDTDGGRVLQYSQSGRLIQVFSNHFNLTKPVAVNVLESGDVLVADGHFDQILHFNSAGQLLATYGRRGEGAAEFLNITTMALGPDGFYVGARVGRHVQVLSLGGDYSYAFEDGRVIFPSAIVVDRNNRSYVADLMDNQIKVFDRGRLIATIGSAGTAPGKFMRVTDLWLDERFLYIVDSLNARIQVARLVPEGIPALTPEPAAK